MLDLGASPGSWALYAASRVGPGGRVLAVDLKACEVALPPQVEFREADVATLDPSELGGPFDVVLSDMAPKTSGQRHADQYRSFELFLEALRLAYEVLSAEGSFVGKIFQGPEYEEARAQLREMFDTVRTIRPKATRGESYEVFLVGTRSADSLS